MIRYIPILKAKAAEFDALSHAGAERSGMTPLLEVVPPDEPELAAIQTALVAFAERTDQKWGRNDEFFVDVEAVGETPLSGHLPIEFVFDELRAGSVLAVPVMPLWATATPIAGAVKIIAAADSRGALVRIRFDDLGDVLSTPAIVPAAAAALGLSASLVDVLIDLADVDDARLSAYTAMAVAATRNVATSASWRSITLASGAFPVNLGGLPQGRSTVSRADAQLWRRVTASVGGVDYGDYAIAHPALTTGMQFAPPPQLRYTSTDDWIVLRGRENDPRGNAQFYDLCAALVPTADYSGATFSWGDSYIDQAAQSASVSPPLVGPGAGQRWREVGTSHHLAYVVNRLTIAGAP